MTDTNRRLVEIEQQRSKMHALLRDSDVALMITVSKDGEMITSYMNTNQIERRGLIELLRDTAPRFHNPGGYSEG